MDSWLDILKTVADDGDRHSLQKHHPRVLSDPTEADGLALRKSRKDGGKSLPCAGPSVVAFNKNWQSKAAATEDLPTLHAWQISAVYDAEDKMKNVEITPEQMFGGWKQGSSKDEMLAQSEHEDNWRMLAGDREGTTSSYAYPSCRTDIQLMPLSVTVFNGSHFGCYAWKLIDGHAHIGYHDGLRNEGQVETDPLEMKHALEGICHITLISVDHFFGIKDKKTWVQQPLLFDLSKRGIHTLQGLPFLKWKSPASCPWDVVCFSLCSVKWVHILEQAGVLSQGGFNSRSIEETEHLGIPPHDIDVVGDSDAGMMSLQNASIKLGYLPWMQEDSADEVRDFLQDVAEKEMMVDCQTVNLSETRTKRILYSKNLYESCSTAFHFMLQGMHGCVPYVYTVTDEEGVKQFVDDKREVTSIHPFVRPTSTLPYSETMEGLIKQHKLTEIEDSHIIRASNKVGAQALRQDTTQFVKLMCSLMRLHTTYFYVGKHTLVTESEWLDLLIDLAIDTLDKRPEVIELPRDLGISISENTFTNKYGSCQYWDSRHFRTSVYAILTEIGYLPTWKSDLPIVTEGVTSVWTRPCMENIARFGQSHSTEVLRSGCCTKVFLSLIPKK